MEASDDSHDYINAPKGIRAVKEAQSKSKLCSYAMDRLLHA